MITIAEWAKRRNFSVQNAHKFIKAHGIQTHGQRPARLDPDAADRIYRATKDPEQEQRGKAPAARFREGAKEPEQLDLGDQGNGFYAVKTRRESVKLKLDQLALETKEHRLIDADEARRAWGAHIEGVKTRLFLIAAELGDGFGLDVQLAAEGLIREALTEVSGYQPKAA